MRNGNFEKPCLVLFAEWYNYPVPLFVPISVFSGGGWVERMCWVNFQCWGVLLVWMIVGQGPIALAVGAGGGMFGHFFSHLSFLFSFSLSLGDGPI